MSLIAALTSSSMRLTPKAVCAAAICLALGNPAVLFAQSYPVKPIRIVVTSYGSGPDVMARLIGQRLTEAWGQQVVVDARVGASGRIAGEHVARSAADGYTLMIATSQFAIGAALYEKLTYDPIKDFSPIVLSAHFCRGTSGFAHDQAGTAERTGCHQLETHATRARTSDHS